MDTREAKIYEFPFFLYNFAQGHLRFHVLMLLQKLAAVPEGFVKSIYKV